MSKEAIRILHFSSTFKDPACGIGKYQEQYLAGMANSKTVFNKFFDVSPYQTRIMSRDDLDKTMDKLKEELKDYDIFHIQHEFGLYWDDQFAKIMAAGKAAGKKVVVTVHLSPSNVRELHRVKIGGFGPHSLVIYLRELRHHNRMMAYHIEPMRQADMVLVHNTATAQALESFGIHPTRVRNIPHPVYAIAKPPKTTIVSAKLNKQPDDVIFCVTGFLHRYKGITEAIRALKFLPDNYKLALLGGIKGDSDDTSYENVVTDLIDALGLHDRVYISGFIPDDDHLNSLLSECDVSVYPYDRVYYANASSGALSLAFANAMPVIAYPTESFKEAAEQIPGCVVFCETFAYYELARELQRIDMKKQGELSRLYAEKMAWPKMAKKLIAVYEELTAV